MSSSDLYNVTHYEVQMSTDTVVCSLLLQTSLRDKTRAEE